MCHGNQEPCIKNEEQLSFPTQALVSGTVYREYINVDSKRIKVNEMVQLMEKITTGMITLFTLTEMQGGGQTDVIVMDFRKAFDKVPHNGLLYKLFKCGIDDITLQWLKSFLEKKDKV